MTFNRGNAPVLTGHIWVGADADPTALIKDGGDVFSVATDQKFATIDDKGDLYSLDGQPFYLPLGPVNGGGRIGPEAHPDAVVRFRSLARAKS